MLELKDSSLLRQQCLIGNRWLDAAVVDDVDDDGQGVLDEGAALGRLLSQGVELIFQALRGQSVGFVCLHLPGVQFCLGAEAVRFFPGSFTAGSEVLKKGQKE